MEGLATTCQILYEKDLLDKKNEIIKLKQEIQKLSDPKIVYSNWEEYKNVQNEAYAIIKQGCDEWIIDDTFEYEHMFYQGLTSRQELNLPYYIEQALNLITKNQNKGWCNKVSQEIIYSIRGVLNQLVYAGFWENIYSESTPISMSKFIYDNIVWQLDDGNHAPSILDIGEIIIIEDTILEEDDENY